MNRPILTLALLLGVAAVAPASAASAQSQPECTDDEQQIRIRYSLYFENFRMEDYEAALPDLEWILACAPGFAGNVEDDRNFRRAVELHEALAERTTGPERRAHLERALAYIEQAVPRLEEAGVEVDPYFWILRRGRFLQIHAETFPGREEEVCQLYEQAFEMRPDEIDDFYLQVIAYCRAEAALTGDATVRRDTRDYLENVLLAAANEEAARQYIQTQAERLITTPREQFAFLYERYQQGGAEALSDEEVEEMFSFIQQAGADLLGSAAEAQRVRRELLPVVARLNPTYSRIMSLGSAALEDGEREEAIRFFLQALELAETSQQRRDVHYNVAVVRQQQGQLGTAANHVREALALDANHGPSLFLMGSLIQAGIGSSLQSRAAFWCAADYFSRAANAGVPGAAAAASRAANAAPTSDEYFFQGWRPGQTVTANHGWGSCQARVR